MTSTSRKITYSFTDDDPGAFLRDFKMPFGKYSGTPVRDLPDDYLSYLMDDNEKRGGVVARAIKMEWGRRAGRAGR